MKHQRHYQIASLIQQALAPMLATLTSKGLITIRHISLNGNYSIATVVYTLVGEHLNKTNVQQKLDKAAPLYRLQLARQLNMRQTPTLVFHHDDEGLAADKMRDFLDSIDANADN